MVYLYYTSNSGKKCCWEFQRSRKRFTQKKTAQSPEKHRSSKEFLKMFLSVRHSFWAIAFTAYFAATSKISLSEGVSQFMSAVKMLSKTAAHTRACMGTHHTLHTTLVYEMNCTVLRMRVLLLGSPGLYTQKRLWKKCVLKQESILCSSRPILYKKHTLYVRLTLFLLH